MKVLDNFLKKCIQLQSSEEELNEVSLEGPGLTNLTQAVRFTWPGRGEFHVMPPVIEEHTYRLDRGFVDVDYLRERFKGCFVKDARGNLHSMEEGVLKNFYVDQDSCEAYLPVFNSQVELLDYGRKQGDEWTFQIICDGSHRIYYAVEEEERPIKAIHVQVEGGHLLPYYAVPKPFHPATRLTSKQAEKMFAQLENDKIHLLGTLIKKVAHYDWTPAGINVSSLRGQNE